MKHGDGIRTKHYYYLSDLEGVSYLDQPHLGQSVAELQIFLLVPFRHELSSWLELCMHHSSSPKHQTTA